MPILKKITDTVDGEETTMEEQVFVVEVVNGGQKYWLRGTSFAFTIERADGFKSIDAAAAAIRKAEKFMAPATRRKLVVVPYGGDLVAA